MSDPRFDPPPERQPRLCVRPKDAATLILVRRDGQRPRLLMGQRSRGHVFMPDKWVFPGGRVDPTDSRAPAASELLAEVHQRIATGNVRRSPRAFALAAVRETFEETGLVVGKPSVLSGHIPSAWTDYASHGAAADLSRFAFIARAITPPHRPRRFDARFFYAIADEVLLDDRPHAGGDELLHVQWFELDEAEQLDLPSVTRFVIGEVRRRLAGEVVEPPFLRWQTRKWGQAPFPEKGA